MKANELVKAMGLNAVKQFLENDNIRTKEMHDELKRIVESYELIEKLGGLKKVKQAIDGKHIGYTHFYQHSNGHFCFLDHYCDFIPDHASHIGMVNKAIADVESVENLKEAT